MSIGAICRFLPLDRERLYQRLDIGVFDDVAFE